MGLNYQAENTDKEIEIIKKNQAEILMFKTTITKMKNSSQASVVDWSW